MGGVFLWIRIHPHPKPCLRSPRDAFPSAPSLNIPSIFSFPLYIPVYFRGEFSVSLAPLPSRFLPLTNTASSHTPSGEVLRDPVRIVYFHINRAEEAAQIGTREIR